MEFQFMVLLVPDAAPDSKAGNHDAFWPDQHPALHRSAGDVELPDVRFQKCEVAIVGAKSDDQRILAETDENVADARISRPPG